MQKQLLKGIVISVFFVICMIQNAYSYDYKVKVGEQVQISLPQNHINSAAGGSNKYTYWEVDGTYLRRVSSDWQSVTVVGTKATTNTLAVVTSKFYWTDRWGRSQDLSYAYYVMVEEDYIYVTEIDLSDYSLSLDIGEERQIYATAYPTNATNRNVSWQSSNNSVATVSYGNITAKSVGSAIITCSAVDGGGAYNTCKVTVKAIPVTKITLSKTSLSLEEGSTETLQATITPNNATDKSVTWSSSNTNVATVSTSGKVTSKNAGTATITCKANDGSGVSATCSVTVTSSKIYVSSITLNQSSLNLKPNEKSQLNATVLPTNATDKSITWTSDNNGVATVDNTGKVTAIDIGQATITCMANDGSNVKATCEVTVDEEQGIYLNLISLTCSNETLTQLSTSDCINFIATYVNYGKADYTYSVAAIFDKSENLNLIANGDIQLDYFKEGYNTINYSLALDTVPPGNYYATILWYDEAEEGWFYNSDYLKEIGIYGGLIGDVNGDTYINGTDLVVLANVILGRSENRSSADVNGDGQVNGTDYVILVNKILGKSNSRKQMPQHSNKEIKPINGHLFEISRTK